MLLSQTLSKFQNTFYWSSDLLRNYGRSKFDGKKVNLDDLSYFPMWMEGIILNIGRFGRIITIHQIKSGSYR